MVKGQALVRMRAARALASSLVIASAAGCLNLTVVVSPNTTPAPFGSPGRSGTPFMLVMTPGGAPVVGGTPAPVAALAPDLPGALPPPAAAALPAAEPVDGPLPVAPAPVAAAPVVVPAMAEPPPVAVAPIAVPVPVAPLPVIAPQAYPPVSPYGPTGPYGTLLPYGAGVPYGVSPYGANDPILALVTALELRNILEDNQNDGPQVIVLPAPSPSVLIIYVEVSPSPSPSPTPSASACCGG